MNAEPIQPLFTTLREAGFARCQHPRTRGGGKRCCDCGAHRVEVGWVGGTLDYHREAHLNNPPEPPEELKKNT